MNAGDVEFDLGAGDPAGDEELADQGGNGWARRAALVVAGTLVAGLLVARVATADQGSGRPVSGPSRTAVSRAIPPPFPQRTSAIDVAIPSLPPVSRYADCPEADDGQSACTSSAVVPVVVVSAVVDRFPAAHVSSAVEERLRDTGPGGGGLWFREVRLPAGVRTVIVVVRMRRAEDRPMTWAGDAAGSGIAYVRRVTGRFTVTVRVTSPSGRVPSLDRVVALAQDRRLRSRL